MKLTSPGRPPSGSPTTLHANHDGSEGSHVYQTTAILELLASADKCVLFVDVTCTSEGRSFAMVRRSLCLCPVTLPWVDPPNVSARHPIPQRSPLYSQSHTDTTPPPLINRIHPTTSAVWPRCLPPPTDFSNLPEWPTCPPRLTAQARPHPSHARLHPREDGSRLRPTEHVRPTCLPLGDRRDPTSTSSSLGRRRRRPPEARSDGLVYHLLFPLRPPAKVLQDIFIGLDLVAHPSQTVPNEEDVHFSIAVSVRPTCELTISFASAVDKLVRTVLSRSDLV